MSLAQLFSLRPSATVMTLCCRLGMQLYRSGAISLMERPWSQRSSQNSSFSPLPMFIMVEAWNRARSSAENCRWRVLHALLSSVRDSHSQRSLSARLCRSRSGMPRPPMEVGRHTCCQLTWQCPPFAASFPAQRNPCSILPICLRVFLGGA
uniref:Uncharacterized protein n=1 Tax=Avena sativa TaxID=4498 RepID=A0ACD5VYN3_AVESA